MHWHVLLLLALALASACRAALPGGGGVALGRRGAAGEGAVDTPPRGLELGGRRYPLQLRYTACTGLVNQQYSHIAAFTLAAALGVAEVHLPPAAVRDSFGHMFSTHQDQNQMQWFPARAGALLDVQRLQRSWAEMGITVHEVRRRPSGRDGAGRSAYGGGTALALVMELGAGAAW